MKKIGLIALLGYCMLGMSGCFSLIDWEHNLNHLKVWNRKLNDCHRSVDRIFFDLDLDDPSSDLNFETPNT